MAVLTVVVWHWGTKYPVYYVDRLISAVGRHLPTARVLIAEPEQEDLPLTKIPGCFARLRTFDPAWQKARGIVEGERVVVLDLDLVITGNLQKVFHRSEPFVILQGVNSVNPCPYNGSVWMLSAGYRPDVWSEFSIEAASKVPFYAFPDDQAWFYHMMPTAGAFTPAHGVYGFMKPGWSTGNVLPSNAKIVAFPGSRDPLQFTHLKWVAQHWR